MNLSTPPPVEPSLSGFTIIRNAELYGYPVVEAIRSILTICDEFIVNVGASDDGTLDLIRSIDSPKLKIIETVWDQKQRTGGLLLSIETNKALRECRGDWCFYIQADEVLHDRYLPAVKEAVRLHHPRNHIEGLVFGYTHFYGSYDYYQDNYRKWYVRETRVIRRKPDIVSWGDAMGFRHEDGRPLKTVRVPVTMYHYGHVRPPKVMLRKWENFERLYLPDEAVEEKKKKTRLYSDLGHLERFRGTHPTVMTKRILDSEWDFDPKIDRQPPRWIRHILLFFHPVIKRLFRSKR